MSETFNIAAVVQGGRLGFEAVVLAASLRLSDPDFTGKLYLLEPQKNTRWRDEPGLRDDRMRGLLTDLGAVVLPFENRYFGQSYPYGNKIEGLAALPDAPFLFLDTDTLVLAPLAQVDFDFNRPSASMRREGTWPQIELYGPGYREIWTSLFDRYQLDFASTLDLTQPDEYWQRYLYFNAGWFFHKSPRVFGEIFTRIAVDIRDNRPDALVCQELDPWLDQVALPLVIAALGGGRPGPGLSGLDGNVTCHYRSLPLLYARESDRAVEVLEAVVQDSDVKKVVKDHEPFRKLVYQRKGARIREMFDRADLPVREQGIRNAIKREGLWFR